MDTETFKAKLIKIFSEAQKLGARSIKINSGDLHREVGGYPGTQHRMPVCCLAMYALQRAGDRVVSAPSKGKGASLTIEYMLPR